MTGGGDAAPTDDRPTNPGGWVVSDDKRRAVREREAPESLQGRVEAARAALRQRGAPGASDGAPSHVPADGPREAVRAGELEPTLREGVAAGTVLLRARDGSRDPERAELVEAKARAQFPPVQPSALLLDVCLQMKSHRLRRNLTLGDVAARTGMDSATLSRLENGRLANPTLSTLQRYAAAIGLRLRMDVAEAGGADEEEHVPRAYPVRFIHEEATVEALRERWIRGIHAGHDVGAAAIRDWIDRHWNGFLRARWLEHLEGRTYWAEIDADDFGILARQFRGSPHLDAVVELLKAGGENLSIVNWAIDRGLPPDELDEIISILQEIDVNRIRIKHQLDSLLGS
jgi:transcriptional regulator with XRE-family HTH domain